MCISYHILGRLIAHILMAVWGRSRTWRTYFSDGVWEITEGNIRSVFGYDGSYGIGYQGLAQDGLERRMTMGSTARYLLAQKHNMISKSKLAIT